MAKVLQFIIFLGMSTVAMCAIAIAVLAQPYQQYVLDQEVIKKHERFVESLEAYRDEQNVLLQNVDNPSVVTRAAIMHFNYRSVEAVEDQSPRDQLVGMTESLEEALAQLDIKQIATDKKSYYRQFILALSDEPIKCKILIILGAGLILVCLTFYNGKMFQKEKC
jgi:hypothetical protein